jgi:hypothetical protein
VVLRDRIRRDLIFANSAAASLKFATASSRVAPFTRCAALMKVRVYAECADRGVTPVIPLRRNSGVRESSLPCIGDEWKRLYRGRSAVEREFGRLKHHYALAMLAPRHRACPPPF